MFLNKRGTLHGSLLRMLDRTFPLEHCPSAIIVCGQLTENRFKIHLPVSKGAKSPRTIHPSLVSAIHALFSCWIELSILYMKHFNPFMIIIYVCKVVKALQNE